MPKSSFLWLYNCPFAEKRMLSCLSHANMLHNSRDALLVYLFHLKPRTQHESLEQ
jgi:hypothetical protein